MKKSDVESWGLAGLKGSSRRLERNIREGERRERRAGWAVFVVAMYALARTRCEEHVLLRLCKWPGGSSLAGVLGGVDFGRASGGVRILGQQQELQLANGRPEMCCSFTYHDRLFDSERRRGCCSMQVDGEVGCLCAGWAPPTSRRISNNAHC